MQITSKLRLLAVLVLGLTLALAACAPAAPVAPADEPVELAEGETTAEEAAPAAGGSLSISIYGDIDNFDPHWNQLIVYEAMIRTPVFDSLVELDENMQIQPALAESWEQPDERTWIFHLRQGVTFHDGSDFTADDVIYSYERTIEQEMIFANKLAIIEEMEAIDDHTLQLTLESPWAPLLDDLYSVAIVPEGATDEDLQQNPIGTGPFRFVEWVPNDHITLEKNPDYWKEGKPLLDELVIRILPDALVARANLQSGDIDAVYDMPIADAQAVRDDPNVVWQTPPASGSVFLFELGISNHEALQDVRVRRALAHALDKATIQRNVYFGEGEILWSPLPKFSWAYTEQPGYEYDLEQAQALLAEAGHEDLELTLEIISGIKVMEDIATIWQASLDEIGVTLNINKSELNIWLDKYVNQDYDVIANWFNVSSDPNSMFDIIFIPLLDSVYDNPEMRELIEAGGTTLDQAEREAIYDQLQQMTVEQVAPIIVVQTQPILALTSPNVENFKLTGKNTILFDEVSIRE